MSLPASLRNIFVSVAVVVVSATLILFLETNTCHAEESFNYQTLYLRVDGMSAACPFPYEHVGTPEVEQHALMCCEEHFVYDQSKDCIDYVIKNINEKAFEYYKQATKCPMMLCPTLMDTHMLIASDNTSGNKLLRASVGAAAYINSARFHWWGESGVGLSIGRYAQVAGNVEFFLGGNHCYKNIATYPFDTFFPEVFLSISNKKECPYSNGKIIVGSDVWIGEGASVFSGVTIGHGAVIGAHATVRKDVPPFAIVIGNPGTVVGFRHNEEQIKALLRIAWWDWDLARVLVKKEMQMLTQDNVDLFIAMHDLPSSSSSSVTLANN